MKKDVLGTWHPSGNRVLQLKALGSQLQQQPLGRSQTRLPGVSMDEVLLFFSFTFFFTPTSEPFLMVHKSLPNSKLSIVSSQTASLGKCVIAQGMPRRD